MSIKLDRELFDNYIKKNIEIDKNIYFNIINIKYIFQNKTDQTIIEKIFKLKDLIYFNLPKYLKENNLIILEKTLSFYSVDEDWLPVFNSDKWEKDYLFFWDSFKIDETNDIYTYNFSFDFLWSFIFKNNTILSFYDNRDFFFNLDKIKIKSKSNNYSSLPKELFNFKCYIKNIFNSKIRTEIINIDILEKIDLTEKLKNNWEIIEYMLPFSWIKDKNNKEIYWFDKLYLEDKILNGFYSWECYLYKNNFTFSLCLIVPTTTNNITSFFNNYSINLTNFNWEPKNFFNTIKNNIQLIN